MTADARGRRAVAAAAVLIALGAGATIPALAQDAGEPDAQAEAAPHDGRAAERRRAFAAALAQELGLNGDDVAAAIERVHAAMAQERRGEHRAALAWRLDAAVAQDRLTREQADALLAAFDAGVLGDLWRPGPRHGHGRRGSRPGGPDAAPPPRD